MMIKLSNEPSRAEVLEFLFDSSRYGNLGLFVGAGFSKAVLNIGVDDIALSWGPLLEAAAKKMGVDYAPLKRDGASFPEIASALCVEHSKAKGMPYDESVLMLKRTLCSATAWYPAESERTEFARYLEALAPSWIVTTNYDQVLECLLSGKSVSLGPNDGFSSAKEIIPIFHLHGARTAPEDIIITQEDYVKLFRPAEYRQMRLALTMKESTTCLLGYGLGDVNVLTALDWSKSVYEKQTGEYPHEVIQVYRTEHPVSKPYRSNDGIVIVEVSEISGFCKEYIVVMEELDKKRNSQNEDLTAIAKLFAESEPTTIKRFLDDDSWRRGVLQVLAKFRVGLVGEFELVLNECFKEARERSSKDGAFGDYAKNLNVTLDILIAFPYKNFPPALFPLAAMNLDRIAPYIGRVYGTSWAAQDTWDARKGELSKEVVAELRAIADQYYHTNLKVLLNSL